MLSRRSRFAAPVVVTGLIAAGAWLPTWRASASPDLPVVSAQRLVDKALGEKVQHLSGTFTWSADLGLPSFGDLTGGGGQGTTDAGGFNPTSLLSGRHTFEVWINGGAEQRIAAPGTLQESDAVHRGNQAWVYESSTNHVTHYILREHGRRDAGFGARVDHGVYPGKLGVGLTPAGVADQLLADVRSIGTRVSVSRPVEVAGRAAYELRLAPDRSVAANRASTVSYATVAVDARTGLPLRTTIYAVGHASPALQIGFTALSLSTPSASEFAALEGQSTTTKVIAAPAADRVAGAWYGTSILGSSTATTARTRGPSCSTVVGRTSPPGASPSGARWAQGPVTLPAVVSCHPIGAITAQSRVLTPEPAGSRSWAAIADERLGRLGTRGDEREIDSLTTAVSGRWGSGRLLSSTLFNALLLGNGRVLVGAVTPRGLEAAAAHIPR